MIVNYSGRISIIGAGTLGGTIAYGLIMDNMADEILLVDMSTHIVQGQVLDLAEAAEGTNLVLRAGTFKEAGQSSIVIITADVEQYEGEEHTAWLIRSRRLFLGIMSSITPIHDDIMFLVVNEPVDLYVQALIEYFPRLSRKKVFGIGTTLATLRFQTWLGQLTNATQQDITDAYCIGSQHDPMVVWSQAKIQGAPITTIPILVSQRANLDTIVSIHRYQLILKRKGKAWYGTAGIATRLVQELLKYKAQQKKGNKGGRIFDSTAVNPTWVLSVYVPQLDTCMSWPVTLNYEGINDIIPLPLASDEMEKVMILKESNLIDFQNSNLSDTTT